MSKYSEDHAVEQPAIDLFDDLGWETVNVYYEDLATEEKLVMDWTKQQQRIADVKVTIEKELNGILPDQYDRQLFAQICNEVFDHVYQSY